jgi:MFS transporter, FSR family, fosmidomycin resistance protein
MRQTGHFQSSKIISVSFAHFVHDVYSSFLAPLAPLLMEKFAFSYTFISVLTLVQRLPSLFNPLIGWFLNTRMSYIFIVSAPSVTAVVMSLLGIAPSRITLIFLLLLMGVSASLFHVPAPVAIRRFSGPAVGRGMSFFMVGGELARTVGPMVILSAVSLWGLEGAYRLIPGGLAVSLFLAWNLRHLLDVAEIPKPAKGKKETGLILGFFAAMSLFLLFTAGLKAAMTLFLPTFLRQQGSSILLAGAGLSLVEGSGVLGTFFSGAISDILGRRKVLLISAIGSPSMALLFLNSQGWLAFVFLFLTGFFIFAPGPVLLAMVQELPGDGAFLNGIYMTLNFILAVSGSFFVGLSGDFWGMKRTFIFSILLAAFAAPSLIWLKERLNDKKKIDNV